MAVSSLFTACAAAGLAAVGGPEMTAGNVTASSAQLVAAQRIRADTDRHPDACGAQSRRATDCVRRAAASVIAALLLSARACIDRSTGVITQESIDPNRTPAQGDNHAPSLSANGGIVAPETVAQNLLPDDLRFAPRHVVVRNRQNGVLRTPQGPRGQRPKRGESGQPIVSGNGLTLVFTSDAVNLCQAPTRTVRRPTFTSGD